MRIGRRTAVSLLGAAGAMAFAGLRPAPAIAQRAGGNVVVVGGGFGGATTAKYVRRYAPDAKVTLIEREQQFHTCPFSNLVLGGLRRMENIAHGYEALRKHGIEVVRDTAAAIDASARSVRLAGGQALTYDALVIAPGIDIRFGALEGYDEKAAERAPHAWKAGPQTELLRRQLTDMEDGGLFVMVAPANPFRCPPGPYERAAMVAHYFKTAKPSSKILILDAKDSFSKQGLFEDGWKKLYGDMIEWVPMSKDGKVVRVDAANLTVETEFGTRHKANVLNVIPPQAAGRIAHEAGLVDDSGWVPIKPATFEAAQAEGIYVVGDATVSAPMPKSAFCANGQGKVVAAVIAARLAGREPPAPSWANTCYSLIGPDYGISVAGVYTLGPEGIAEIKEAGGVSPREASDEFRRNEARFAVGWYDSITSDTFG